MLILDKYSAKIDKLITENYTFVLEKTSVNTKSTEVLPALQGFEP